MPSFNFSIMGLLDSILGAGGDFLSYTPWSWVDSAVESGLDSLGLSQHGRDQYFQQSLQREMLEKQQAFQREMFGLSTDFAREQTYNQQWFTKQMYQQQLQDMLKNYPELMKMQSDAQFNLWRNQFKMQNDYNSPGAQTARLLGAGINPSSVFGGSGSVAVSQMSPSSVGGQPPMISPTPFNSHMFGSSGSPVGLPSGYVGNMRDNLSSIGSFIRDVAQARKSNKEASRYDEVTDAMVEKMWAEAQNEYALACYNGVKTVIERALGKEAKKSEILLNLRKAMVYGAQEKTEEALKWVYQAEAWLTNTKNEALQEQLPYISQQIQSLIHFLKTGSQKNVSEASLNYAKRDLTLEQKETQKWITDTNYWTSKMNELEYVFKNETQVERLHQYIEWSRSQGLIADQLAIDVEKAIETKDYAELKELMTVIGMGVDAYSKVGHVQNGQDFNANYSARNAIEDAYVNHKMDHYGDTEETYTETGINSRGHKITRSFNRRRAPQ